MFFLVNEVVQQFITEIHCFLVLKLCKNENTRKLHSIAYESKNSENIELLEEAIRLRRKAAKVLIKEKMHQMN